MAQSLETSWHPRIHLDPWSERDRTAFLGLKMIVVRAIRNSGGVLSPNDLRKKVLSATPYDWNTVETGIWASVARGNITLTRDSRFEVTPQNAPVAPLKTNY